MSIDMILLTRSEVKQFLASEGTRQSVQDRALKEIGKKKVYYGSDGIVTLIKVGVRYGWSKVCRYMPNRDNFNHKRGGKLALLRALDLNHLKGEMT